MKNKQQSDSHNIGPTIKTDFLQITVTAAHKSQVVDLITTLTKKRIVACAQVQGPESWISADKPLDWRCRFKTSNKLFEQVRVEIDRFFESKTYRLQHSSIVKGSEHFLNWLKLQLNQ